MRWQEFERVVRQYAQIIWSAPAEALTINGVKCDCVVKHKKDYWALVEISKRSSLSKMREDLSKFATMKPYLLSRGIYAECIFVTERDESSLINSGEGRNIEVFSIHSFFNKYFGSEKYQVARLAHPFGSAVDPEDGAIDRSEYVATKYIDSNGCEYTIAEIAVKLSEGAQVVIQGEFGAGKSRCVMELFKHLTAEKPEHPPIAINMRDIGGLKSFHTIIAEHFARLGVGDITANLTRSISFGHQILLLDGFDELASQAWSGDKKRIREVRKRTFEGIRDLVNTARKAGILITGRRHYFNDDKELTECVGFSEKETLFLKCPDEFTEDETRAYLAKRIGNLSYPQWFPRKPLLCQVLSKLSEEDLKQIITDNDGEIRFFEKTLDVICKRETKFNPSVFADNVKLLYLELARRTREKESRVGPLSLSDIYGAFEMVTGVPPVDDSIVLLQRLAYLGRTDASSDNRVFIDEYVADGLTGLAIVEDYFVKKNEPSMSKWKNSLGLFGLQIVGSKIKFDDEFVSYLRKLQKLEYYQISSDLFAATINSNDHLDYKNLELRNCNISFLEMSNKVISNLNIFNPSIDDLIIENNEYHNVSIYDGTFGNTFGVTSSSGFPSVFINCDSLEYEKASNSANIALLEVSDSHKTLLSIVKKLFFQPGGGRKEEALLRGAERFWNQDAAEKVLHFMLANEMVTKNRGDTGWIYIPQRKFKPRMGKLYAELNNSSEEIWKILLRH